MRVGKLVLGCVAVLAAGTISADAQSSMPDAQVEANVLKALAGAPELASEAITTQTVYGNVTLSGTVRDDSARRRAETLAANADGVKKVIDELSLRGGDVATVAGTRAAQPPQYALAEPQSSAVVQQQGIAQLGSQQAAPLVLQSDGTYAPATQNAGQGDRPLPGTAPEAQAQRNDPENDQRLDQQVENQQGGGNYNPAQPQAGTVPGQAAPDYPQGYPQAGAPAPAQPDYGPYGRRPMYTPGYPQYPYGQNGAAPYPQQPYAQQPYPQQPYAQPPYPQVAGGQRGGETVVVPSGTMLRVRINRPLSSNRTPAGTSFDGVVVNDVVAGNQVAIPRGASVQGTVLDATSSGALKGRGELSIQLTQVTLGGRIYPLVSDVWGTHGRDKTIETVNKTLGLGAVGAVVGALAGGGVGAAVGGGVGAAAGLGSSAASGDGQVYVPAEALVTFHTAQPASVTTVSEQEMQRLAYGVPAGADPARGYRRPYPRVYVGPGYPGYYPYRAPYGPYGYPNY